MVDRIERLTRIVAAQPLVLERDATRKLRVRLLTLDP